MFSNSCLEHTSYFTVVPLGPLTEVYAEGTSAGGDLLRLSRPTGSRTRRRPVAADSFSSGQPTRAMLCGYKTDQISPERQKRTPRPQEVLTKQKKKKITTSG